MNMMLACSFLLVFTMGTGITATVVDVDVDVDVDDQLLPKLDDAKSKSLKADEFGSAGDGEVGYAFDDYEEGSGYDEEEGWDDEEYDEEYDDEYDEGDEESFGNLIPDPDAKEVDDDWHFVESGGKAKKPTDLLYEYYNEFYEEDYDNDEEKGEENKGPETASKSLSVSNWLLMIASGLSSFAISTLAFAGCWYRRRMSLRKSRMATAPYNVNSESHLAGRPTTVRCLPPSPSSIVKNYNLVPQEAKEFMSSSSLENSSRTLNKHTYLESEKPLLP